MATASVNPLGTQYDKWLRVITLIHYGGREVCLDILHRQEGAPLDGAKLYQLFWTKQHEFQKLLKKGTLKQDQYNLVFPANQITDTAEFDITLFTLVILVIYGKKYKTVIDDLRKLRNSEYHKGNTSFTDLQFNNIWAHITNKFHLYGLKLTLFADLKTCVLDSQSQYRNGYLEALAERNKLQIDNSRKRIDRNKLKIDCHGQEIIENKQEIIENKQEIAIIVQKVVENKQGIDHNDSRLSEAQSQMTDVTKKVDDLTNKFEDLQANKSAAQSQMTDVTKKVDDLTNEFEDLQANKSDDRKGIDRNKLKIDCHGQEILENKQGIDRNDSRLSEAQSHMTDVTKKVDDLTNKFEDLQANKSEAQSQMSDVTKKVDDLTNKFEDLQANKSGTEKECIRKSDINNSKRMRVISYLPNGCVFKIQVQPGYQIQSLKIRCITANQESDWLDVIRDTEVNSGEGENIHYEFKVVDDETLLLKIENLEVRRKYSILLQSNQHQYVDEVIIPASCTYITNVNNVFIVLTPLLGQNNEPLNCHQGLHGYFVKDDDIMTTSISNGAELEEQMTVKEFDAFCKAYLNRNFPKSKNVLVFPLTRMISDPAIQQVAEMFRDFLSTRNNFRALISNLNSKKYIQLCTATDEIDQVDLPYNNRLQVFDERTASVLNIRIIKSTNSDGDFQKEMERCVLDLKYFVSAHRHHSCSCYVMGALAFPNIYRTDIESYFGYYYPKESRQHMKLFYLSKEDLQDVDHLQRWWNNTYEDELKKFDHISKINVDSFKNICAQSMATIALTEISLNLPTISSNSYTQITSLLLNADQIEAIESPSNRKIIIGNYGSGKSIVLDEIAKRRFDENLHTMVKVLILYVVWEEYSLVEVTKKMLLNKMTDDEPDCSPHLTMTCGNMHQIWNDLKKNGEVKFYDFLKHFLEESGYRKVHILIDELPTDVVNTSEMEKINRLFRRHPESSVTIAPQSIIIDRRTSTNEEEMNHNRNCLDQMEMDRFKLVKVMRNSMQINAVVNASQEKLKDTETSLSVYDPSLAEVTMVTESKEKAIPVVSRLKGLFNRVMRTSDSRRASNEKIIQKDHSSQIGGIQSTVSLPQGSVTMPAPKLEQIANFVDNDEPRKESTSIIKSTYSFHAIQNGNGIKDQKPTLIKLPSEVNFKSELSAKILKEILQEVVCLQTLAQTMILCGSMEEIKQVSYCLSQIPDFKFVTYIPQLQGIFPSYEEKSDIFTKFRNGSCLLADSTGVKGVEAKRVIIFASQYEHFKMHSFMETISRGNVWSYILLHLSGKNEKRRTLGNIINELENMHLFNVRPVEMFEDHENFDCQCQNMFDGIYKINQVHLTGQKLKPTFKDYQTSTFDINHSVMKKDYRRFLFTLANVENDKYKDSIYYNLKYKGENWSFNNVYRLLKNEDYETFHELLKYNGSMLNYMRDDYYNDNTFLIRASYEGSHSIVKYLTKQFADEIDVWAVDGVGRNAYYWAAWFDYVDVMKVLISFDRSRLNDADDIGRTPLHRAARNNKKRMVELLLDAGADVYVVDKKGITPDRHVDVNGYIRNIIENHRTKKRFMTLT